MIPRCQLGLWTSPNFSEEYQLPTSLKWLLAGFGTSQAIGQRTSVSQFHSLWTSPSDESQDDNWLPQRKPIRANESTRKMEITGLCNRISEASFHFCYTPLVIGKPLGPAHAQGQEFTQTPEYHVAGINGNHFRSCLSFETYADTNLSLYKETETQRNKFVSTSIFTKCHQ